MDRRDFFKRGFSKATEAVVEHVDKNARKRASQWIRPPFAIDELDFLLQCTRCDDCIKACEKGLIFSLSAKRGAQVVGTPVLDLTNDCCDLCEDWPCVTACDSDALKLPELDEGESITPPRLALAEINIETCLPYNGPECGACDNTCPIPGALVFELLKPVINPDLCVGCALCREVCVMNPKAITIKSLYTEND